MTGRQIDPDVTAGELSTRLAEMGAALVRRELGRYASGALTPRAQDHSRATLAPLLTKDDERIDLVASARAVHDRVRGMSPWPGARLRFGDERIKILRTRVVEPTGRCGAPGEVLRAADGAIEMACGDGSVAILELQAEGKRALDAVAFLAGHPLAPGARFDS